MSTTPLCNGAKEDGHIKTFGWEYFARQLERSLTSRVTAFGDAVADVFEQLDKGAWTDDHDHPVKLNDAMLRLKDVLEREIEIRANVDSGDNSELQQANAQIAALRGALEELNNAPWLNLPGRARDIVEQALSSPAPQVVPLTDADALADKLDDVLRLEKSWRQCEYTLEKTERAGIALTARTEAEKALKAYRAKHPQQEKEGA